MCPRARRALSLGTKVLGETIEVIASLRREQKQSYFCSGLSEDEEENSSMNLEISLIIRKWREAI